MPSQTSRKANNPDAKTHARPVPPLPAQHQERPGAESKLSPKPQFKAPQYKGSGKLVGKVALITGGDSGIGRSVAVLFAREGADVAIVHLPEEHNDADETLAAIREEGKNAVSIAGDVTDAEFCQKAVDKTIKAFSRLDILVNNAAFQQHRKRLIYPRVN